MMWVIFALFTALFESLKDLASKKSLDGVDPYVVACGLSVFGALCLLNVLFFVEVPEIGGNFWWALVASSLMQAGIWVIYMKALQAGDMSLSVPMVTFTPLFLLLTSPLTIGEFPSALGLFGVALIVLGSYVLNMRKGRGVLAPFSALFNERGPRLMLTVAFLWSITAVIDKIALKASSPLFWGLCMYSGIAVCNMALMFRYSPNWQEQVRSHWKSLFLIGLAASLMIVCHMTAISTGLVVYVVSIKRMSIILSVVWGYLFFGEKGIAQRLGAAGIMLLGVFLISAT